MMVVQQCKNKRVKFYDRIGISGMIAMKLEPNFVALEADTSYTRAQKRRAECSKITLWSLQF